MQLVCLRQRTHAAFIARAHDTNAPLTPMLSAAVDTSVDMFACEGAALAEHFAGSPQHETGNAAYGEPTADPSTGTQGGDDVGEVEVQTQPTSEGRAAAVEVKSDVPETDGTAQAGKAQVGDAQAGDELGPEYSDYVADSDTDEGSAGFTDAGGWYSGK